MSHEYENNGLAGSIDDDKPESKATHFSEDSMQQMRSAKEAPPLVRDLTHEEMVRLEKLMLRKVDLRLMPMIVIIYIMNYVSLLTAPFATRVNADPFMVVVGSKQYCL